MGTVLLNESVKICRLCGKEQQLPTISLFEDTDDTALKEEISFFLPIQLSENSPFPRGICKQCHSDFGIVSSFFVNLNEGQAKLADLLRQNESIHIYMPDWMSERRALFSTKYPAFDRSSKKRKVEEKIKSVKTSSDSISTTKDTTAIQKDSAKENPADRLEQALEEIFKDGEKDKCAKTSVTGAGKRVRKLPKRLAESIQGNDLEKMFKRDSLDLDYSSGHHLKVTKSKSGPGLENQIPTQTQGNKNALLEPSTSGKEDDKREDSTIIQYQSHINDENHKEEQNTELVIVKLADTDTTNISPEMEEPFQSNAVKIHIINEDLSQGKAQVVSEFKIKTTPNLTSSSMNPSSSETVIQSDEIETITLQVDENTQLEAIGAMLTELESTREEREEQDDIESTHFGSKGSGDANQRKINVTNSRVYRQSASSEPFVSSNKGKKRNRCDVCQKSFRLTSKLAHHRSAAHSGVFFTCSTTDCTKRYKTKDALLLHQKMLSHSGVELFDPNPKKLRRKKTLESSAKQQRYSCEECSKTFLHLWDLCEHRQHKHNDPINTSSNIPKTSPNKTSSSISNDTEVYECRVCSKTFKNKALLMRHSNIVHTNERPHECTLCDLKFKSSTNLKAHQTSHSNEKKFACDKCEKQFAYKTSLAQHIKCQHEGEKSFRCPHCNKTFSQNGNLQEHIRIHTGYKPFACDICGRKFTTSSQHRLHIKRHKGEKPWACQFCPKAFLHKESWTAHMRRHRGDRPFVCEFDFCKKAFSELWALKKHTRLHTGEKPYICQLCPKSFSDCSNLTKHRKTHQKDASIYQSAQSFLPSKSMVEATNSAAINVDDTKLLDESSQMIKEGCGSNDEYGNVSNSEKPSAKRQVWNILNEAAGGAEIGGVSDAQIQNEEEDVEQIIYITYDTEDKEMQVLNEKSIVGQPDVALNQIPSNTDEDVLSQLSSNIQHQQQSIVIPSTQPTNVIGQALEIDEQPNSTSIQDQDSWTMVSNNSTKNDLSTTSIIVESTPATSSHEISQEIVNQDPGEEEGNESANGSVYVDIRLTDNELEQPIRLRVPPNFDPIAYATEYIQLHTSAQSDDDALLQNQNLELQIQNVGDEQQVNSDAPNTEQVVQSTQPN